MVVSNNGTSPLMIDDGMATLGTYDVKYVTNIEISNAGSLTFSTTDSSGAAKSIFNPGIYDPNTGTTSNSENVYFVASGLLPSTTYPIYVFIKNDSWAIGDSFSSITRHSHTVVSVTTDSSGNIALTSIYTQIASGEYYIVVDMNSNGVYDISDLLINNVVVTLEVTARDADGNVLKTLY